MPELSIVIPAHNEEKNIVTCLEKMMTHLSGRYNYEIIISEDGSTDRTYELAKNYAKKNNKIKVFHSKERLGKGGGIIKGFRKSTGDIVIFSDADLSCPPSEIDKLVHEIKNSADIAIASRKLKDSKIKNNRPFTRKFSSKVFNILVNLLFGFNLKDTQCGLKAIKKRALQILLPELKKKNWEFDVELLLKAKQKNFKISEVPVVWFHKDTTKFSLFKDSFKMGVGIFDLWLKEVLDKFSILFMLILISFFISSLFLFGSYPVADEGTHNLLGLYFYDLVDYLLKYPTISYTKIYDYTIAYLTYYPKLSLYYPPLFHIVLSFMYRIFGISFFAGSLTTLFFSVGTLFLIFKFSRKFFKKPETGLIFSIIFVLSPAIIYLSIKTMTDMPLFFFFFLSIYLYLSALETNKTKNFVLSSVSLTLGILTKWNVVLVVPIVFLYSLLERRECMKKLLLSFFLAFLFISPYLYLAYKADFLYLPLKSSVLAGYRELDPQYMSLEGWLYYLNILSEKYFTLPIFGFSLLALIFYSKRKQEYWKLFLIWFLVSHLFFTWLPNKDYRYIMVIFPSLVFPLASFVTPMESKLKFVSLISISALLLITSFSQLKQTFQYNTDFNSIINNVTEKEGNILLASETDFFYSSSFMFELASTEGRYVRKVFRPCVLDEANLSELLSEEGIRYVIIAEPVRNDHKQNTQKIYDAPLLHHLNDIKNGENVVIIYENLYYKLSESKCNYICLLDQWICQKQMISVFNK